MTLTIVEPTHREESGAAWDRSDERLSRSEKRSSSNPTLTIVIPALNEEESIGSTVQRCLDARNEIETKGHLGGIEVIVVSDGSTDRTVEIAAALAEQHDCVKLIVFERNRGYGAAIKAGFEQGTGDLVAFLDADGTCDPRYFAPLCRLLQESGAAISLGCRMGKDSKMPPIRRLGNRMYALLLGFASGRSVEDTASGMRVIRRDALPALYPLPDGLHFTPAMSARALLTDLGIVEVPMTYSERVGRSKLSVLKDGVRFLVCIVKALLLFRPGRVFAIGAVLCLFNALLWGLFPVEFYFRNGRLEEWMIYRVLLAAFSGEVAFVLLSASAVCEHFLEVVHPRSKQLRTFFGQTLLAATSRRALGLTIAGCCLTALLLVGAGFYEYATTGHITIHWSRVVLASLLLQAAVVAATTAVLRQVIALWSQQLTAPRT